MKKKLLFFFIFTSSISFVLQAAMPKASLNATPEEIIVHNRILARVNGKVISVLDVMKKLDLSFYRQYPELTSSPVARYQFYMGAWKNCLAGMIDDELIIADAEEKKVEITDGDVREEMEALFGPNVVLNIDKIGLTFEEAWSMLKKELLVRRMIAFMVRAKAIQQVHPKKVKELYEQFARENKKEEQWRYRVVSIKSQDEEKSRTVAEIACKLLEEEKIPLEFLKDKLLEKGNLDEEIVFNVSEEYCRNDKELSLAHKAILQTLSIGSHSSPIVQTSKDGSELTHRIFYLVEKVNGAVAPFKTMEDKFRKEITQKALEKENDLYIKKLRRHYGITDKYLKQMVPERFVPFSME